MTLSLYAIVPARGICGSKQINQTMNRMIAHYLCVCYEKDMAFQRQNLINISHYCGSVKPKLQTGPGYRSCENLVRWFPFHSIPLHSIPFHSIPFKTVFSILCPFTAFGLGHYFCSDILSHSEPLKARSSKSTWLTGMIQKLICFFYWVLSNKLYFTVFADIEILVVIPSFRCNLGTKWKRFENNSEDLRAVKISKIVNLKWGKNCRMLWTEICSKILF